MNNYFLVALAGGSIRGIFQMEIWDILTEKFPELQEKVQLYVGTSVGGISGGSLAAGLDIETIKQIFLKRVPAVLKQSFIRKLSGGWVKASYDVQKLIDELHHEYGFKKLRNLFTDFACTTFILDNQTDGLDRRWKEKIFESLTGRDDEELLANVVAMTAAAPGEFSSVSDRKGSAGFDGGLYDTHPILTGIGQTQDERNRIGVVPIGDVRGLLIGTGINPGKFIKGSEHDYGKLQLVTKELLPNFLIDGVSGRSIYLASKWIGDNFNYIDAQLPFNIGFGDMDKMPLLIEIARDMARDGLLDTTYEWIERKVLL